MTLNDAILAATGGPTVNDGLRAYYNAQGVPYGSLDDMERAFLRIQLPIATGTTNDLWMQYLSGTFGYTGTLNDMQRKYWNSIATIPPLGPNEHNLTVGNGSSAMGYLQGAYGDIDPTAVGAETIEGIYVGSNDTMYIQFVGGVQVGTSVSIDVAGPNGVVTCSWIPATFNYRSIVTPGLFAALSTEVDNIITIEILPA